MSVRTHSYSTDTPRPAQTTIQQSHTLTHKHSKLERDSNNPLFDWCILLQWVSAAMQENVTTIQLNWDVIGQCRADGVLWLVILSCLEVFTLTNILWDIINVSSVCLAVLYLLDDVRRPHRTVSCPGRPWAVVDFLLYLIWIFIKTLH